MEVNLGEQIEVKFSRAFKDVAQFLGADFDDSIISKQQHYSPFPVQTLKFTPKPNKFERPASSLHQADEEIKQIINTINENNQTLRNPNKLQQQILESIHPIKKKKYSVDQTSQYYSNDTAQVKRN